MVSNAYTLKSPPSPCPVYRYSEIHNIIIYISLKIGNQLKTFAQIPCSLQRRPPSSTSASSNKREKQAPATKHGDLPTDIVITQLPLAHLYKAINI